ncbi:hypothetical protein AG1IA_08084 [Rhizoctonia solani AG-1 IA]|uniref:Uncharacterized protein n=1 Tax=Thanatephorus cucumeris (strain AG1-IA) TaxID=983506 RepID=L8WI65_THACA|nr:hypothetical protein AG1IA_08084 [Rhizoctonia solani AG-1 IA]
MRIVNASASTADVTYVPRVCCPWFFSQRFEASAQSIEFWGHDYPPCTGDAAQMLKIRSYCIQSKYSCEREIILGMMGTGVLRGYSGVELPQECAYGVVKPQ